MWRRSSWSRIAAVVVVALCLTAGSCRASGDEILRGEGTLRVLAGSSLVDLQPVLDDIRHATGVTVQLSYIGTLDGVRAVAGGSVAGGYDAAWFDTSRYFDLLTAGRKVVDGGQTIMRSPVVVGVRETVAHRLGWDVRRPTWGDIADAAAAHQLGFAMTNPAASNSGFCALVGMATALAPGGAGHPLTLDLVRAAAPRLRALLSSQQLTAGSSGWLADAYVKRARDGDPIDAMVNYEAVLLSLNASGQLTEKLTLVYPSDGAVMAEYPLTLLTGASAQARTNHAAVTAYLLRPEVQQKIMDSTHRRPVNPRVPLANEFPQHDVDSLPFPDSTDVVDSLIAAYGNTLRRPARTIYVLDTSGSMKGERINALRDALLALTGVNQVAGTAGAGFQQREQVILLPFSNAVSPPQQFDVPVDGPETALAAIAATARRLTATGDTAIYEALVRAYDIAAQPAAGDPYTTIVLLTDGERTVGRTFDQFRAYHQVLDSAGRRTPTFPLLFGENDQAEMTALAQLTGGRAFDARTGSLTDVFKEIRGYQ